MSPALSACSSGTRMPVPVESTVPAGTGLERPSHSTSSVHGRFISFVLTRRSEEHTSELQSQSNLVCRLLLEKKKDRTRALSYYHASIRSRGSRVLRCT